MLLLLKKVISPSALKGISDERNHDLHCRRHGSEVEDKDSKFPFLDKPSNHGTDNKSKYDYFLPSTLGIAHTPRTPEGYECQQKLRNSHIWLELS